MKPKPTQMVVHSVEIEEVRHPVWVRPGTSDGFCLHQIFAQREYDFNLPAEPRVIVDAGANAGFAAVLFATRYPRATIFAIEPELSNFTLLKVNARPYPNIRPIRAALWHKDETIAVTDPGSGLWGFQVQAAARPEDAMQRVPGLTIDRLRAEHDIANIDLLKVDIEGSEKPVFEASSSWIGHVRTIVIELHDRFQPGCRAAFEAAVGQDFPARHHVGENLIASRESFSRPALCGNVNSE